jgi:hypothetical protein
MLMKKPALLRSAKNKNLEICLEPARFQALRVLYMGIALCLEISVKIGSDITMSMDVYSD